MNKQQLLENLKDYNSSSRIWIYQADKVMSKGEVDIIESHIKPFATTWNHHGENLKSYAAVLYNIFIVFIVDETNAEVGGCGIDSSVHLVQKISKEMNIDFFNRLAVSYFQDEKVLCATKNSFTEIVQKADFSEDTLVFNNQVKTLQELDINWIVAFKNSWHQNFFSVEDSFDLSL